MDSLLKKRLCLRAIATHFSIFDGSLQGIEHVSKPIFGFQGHPEASPGPNDLYNLFGKFLKSMENRKKDLLKCQKERT